MKRATARSACRCSATGDRGLFRAVRTQADSNPSSGAQRLSSSTRVAVIGAGPAGLTAAYLLAKQGLAVDVLEADPEYVGGISRTARYKGFHFDIGGHRFFSKSQAVEDLWTELLPDDMLHRPRTSRIYYNGNFFAYPLKATEALLKLGPFEAARCVLPTPAPRPSPILSPRNFEEWVVNQFGHRLFKIFFKTYTEKVWGMACTRSPPTGPRSGSRGCRWAPRSGRAGAAEASRGSQRGDQDADRHLPLSAKGPGMLWEAAARKVQALGGEVEMGRRVAGSRMTRPRRWTVPYDGASEPAQHRRRARGLFGAAAAAGIGVSPRVAGARRRPATLRYRDFITVVLILQGPRSLRRQLDLHPRSEGEGRPDAELQVLVAGDGPRPSLLLRAGIFLLRRATACGRRRTPT